MKIILTLLVLSLISSKISVKYDEKNESKLVKNKEKNELGKNKEKNEGLFDTILDVGKSAVGGVIDGALKGGMDSLMKGDIKGAVTGAVGGAISGGADSVMKNKDAIIN
jgi:hypothetical protein